MEQILKNTALFINVMGMSRTSAVQQWDIEELKKAFKWADYFQQVYFKLKTREKQRDILGKELVNQSCASGAQLGTSILQFEDLKDGKHILCKNILQNVWCTPEIYAETIKLYYILSELKSINHSYSNDLKEVTKACHISKLLRPIGSELLKTRSVVSPRDSFTSGEEENDKNTPGELCANADASSAMDFEEEFSKQIHSRLLKDHIMKCLGCADSGNLISHIDAVLSNRNDNWNLLRLVYRDIDVERENPDYVRFITKLAKEKLIPKWKNNHKNFLEMPASVVLDIAVISEEIFIDYLRLLFDCCRVYDQQISTEELYLVARIRKAPEVNCIKLETLEIHFKEIQIREEHCIGFHLNIKDDFIMLHASKNDQVPFRMTWDQLSKMYLSFL